MSFYQILNLHSPISHLSVLDNLDNLLPSTKRVYIINSITDNQIFGKHAHKALQQVIIPVNGQFTLGIDNGYEKVELKISSELFEAVKIFPGVWRTLSNFSNKCFLIVLASEPFDENDYIRNYSDFLRWNKYNKQN